MLMSFNAEQSKKLGKGNGNKTAQWLLYLFPAKEESKMKEKENEEASTTTTAV